MRKIENELYTGKIVEIDNENLKEINIITGTNSKKN
jgi:hypothetical protein